MFIDLYNCPVIVQNVHAANTHSQGSERSAWKSFSHLLCFFSQNNFYMQKRDSYMAMEYERKISINFG